MGERGIGPNGQTGDNRHLTRFWSWPDLREVTSLSGESPHLKLPGLAAVGGIGNYGPLYFARIDDRSLIIVSHDDPGVPDSPLSAVTLDRGVTCMAVSVPDVLVGTSDGRLRVWDAYSETLEREQQGNGAAVACVAIGQSAQGLLASADVNGEIRVWPNRPTEDLTLPPEAVQELSLRMGTQFESHDRRTRVLWTVKSSPPERSLRVVDRAAVDSKYELPMAKDAPFIHVTFSPLDTYFVVYGLSKAEPVTIWHRNERRKVASLSGVAMRGQIAFHPDESIVAFLNGQKIVELVDPRDGTTIRTLPLNDAPAFSPSGRLIVGSTGRASGAKILETATGKELQSFSWSTWGTNRYVIDVEEKRLLVSGARNMIFDIETGKSLPTIFGDELSDSVEWAGSVSQDGQRLFLLRRNMADIYCARTFNRLLRVTFNAPPASVDHVEALLDSLLQKWQQ